MLLRHPHACPTDMIAVSMGNDNPFNPLWGDTHGIELIDHIAVTKPSAIDKQRLCFRPYDGAITAAATAEHTHSQGHEQLLP
jgi:hypothetical protein